MAAGQTPAAIAVFGQYQTILDHTNGATGFNDCKYMFIPDHDGGAVANGSPSHYAPIRNHVADLPLI